MLFKEGNVVAHIHLQVVSGHLAHTTLMGVSAARVVTTPYHRTNRNPITPTIPIDSDD